MPKCSQVPPPSPNSSVAWTLQEVMHRNAIVVNISRVLTWILITLRKRAFALWWAFSIPPWLWKGPLGPEPGTHLILRLVDHALRHQHLGILLQHGLLLADLLVYMSGCVNMGSSISLWPLRR